MPGDARRDAARHHLLDRRAAEPLHLLRVDERDHLRADRVHAADAGADHRAACPSPPRRRRVRAARGRRPATPRPRRGSRSGATGSSRRGARRRSSSRRARRRPAARRPPGSAKPCSAIASFRARGRSGPRGARARSRRRRCAFGATTPRPVTTTRRLIAPPRCPRAGPSRRRVPSASVISHVDAQLAPPPEHLLRLHAHARRRAARCPLKSTFASVKNGHDLGRLLLGELLVQKVDPERDHARLGQRLDQEHARASPDRPGSARGRSRTPAARCRPPRRARRRSRGSRRRSGTAPAAGCARAPRPG